MLRLLPQGRLGNQLFQYVAVRAQAKRLGVSLEIDLQFNGQGLSDDTSIWLRTLPIQAHVRTYPDRGLLTAHSVVQRIRRRVARTFFWKEYNEPAFSQDPLFFAIEPYTIVRGYFQSLFYLLPRDDDILSEVNLRKVATPAALEYIKELGAANIVSLHVRRGDYVGNQNYQLPNYEEYIGSAMELLRRRLYRPKFFVFSDDIEWCKRSNVFKGDSNFVEANSFGSNPAIDLLLMSSCSHHILANSSYSWWSAWLNFRPDKLCVLPRYWTHNLESELLGLVAATWITL